MSDYKHKTFKFPRMFKSFVAATLALSMLACGDSASDSQSTSALRITDGHDFGPDSQMSRYVVSFDGLRPIDGSFVRRQECTGVIITAEWVMTAAHCDIRDGDSIRFYKDSFYSGDVRTVLYKERPPGITISHYYNATSKKRQDLMLVKMDRPISLGKDYRPAWVTLDIPWLTKQGKKGWIAGAGNHEGLPNPSNKLKWADAEVTEDFSTHGALAVSTKINNGDSGGPFLANFNNGMELLGINSAVEINGNQKVTYVGEPEMRAWLYTVIPNYAIPDLSGLLP